MDFGGVIRIGLLEQLLELEERLINKLNTYARFLYDSNLILGLGKTCKEEH